MVWDARSAARRAQVICAGNPNRDPALIGVFHGREMGEGDGPETDEPEDLPLKLALHRTAVKKAQRPVWRVRGHDDPCRAPLEQRLWQPKPLVTGIKA